MNRVNKSLYKESLVKLEQIYSTDNKIELKGLSFQGHGIFKDYYTLFRGKGYIITGSSLYGSLINFFTGSYILIYEYSEAAKELKDVMTSENIKSLNIFSPSVDKQKAAYDILTTSGVKLDSFAIKGDVRDISAQYDLAFYRILENFQPEKTSSIAILKTHIRNLLDITSKLMFGGFLILMMPRDSPMLDVVLSSVESVTGARHSMVYNGMMLFDTLKIPIWIFRREPLNISVITARTNMAKKRLRRHPAIYEEYVDEETRLTIPNTLQPLAKEVLKLKITPSHELIGLFNMLINYPREIINATMPYQIKYNKLLESASLLSSKSTLIHVMNEMLYDFALHLQRKIKLTTAFQSVAHIP